MFQPGVLVVAVEAVSDDNELMLITAKGMMLRTDLSALREIGRATQGVRLIRLDETDRVVAVAKLAPEDDNGGNGAATEARGEPESDSSTDAASPPDTGLV